MPAQGDAEVNDGVICSIGCTEPWNAAGLGLDLRAAAELGASCVWVVAGVTAQDRGGLLAAQPVGAALVGAQLAALDDANIAAYRIGALLDEPTLDVLTNHLAGTGVPVIYDPVFAPSGGGSFVDGRLLHAIRSRLLPQVRIVTPNMPEAAMLCGRPVASLDDMEAATLTLCELGSRAALVTGGHRPADVVDVLRDEDGVVRFEAPRLPGTLRGTGCLLAVALAVSLASGTPLREAVRFARAFVRAKIAAPEQRGGMNVAY